MVRDPVVAGQFYPATKSTLVSQLTALTKDIKSSIDAIGVISPHAGYPYSGPVAGVVLGSIKSKTTYIIMGPNHTGLGQPFGISSAEGWKTPLGQVEIDKLLADEIVKNSRYIKYDDLSSVGEHSVEVQLPFLQFLQKDFNFVPMVISYAPLAIYREIGLEIARAIKTCKLEKNVTMIASSDMTHYESAISAKEKDELAIESILALDEGRLCKVVSERDISMCGYAPASIMIVVAKELGAKKARLVRYATSGDATGDYSSVVGYAGIIIQ